MGERAETQSDTIEKEEGRVVGSLDIENGNGDNNDGRVQELSEQHDMKLAIAGVAGNILEWYDFAVFGYFSDVIGEVFFPEDAAGEHDSLVKSFAVFGAAFLARPIGGAVIGWFGDSSGRQSALELSVVLMAFPTFALGCLPSYSSIGGFSTFLLILFRFLQGISVGGQLMASVVFTLEKTNISSWGLWGSSVYAFSQIGVVIGSLFSYILREALSDQQLQDWGWRIPFLLGIFGVIPAYYLKKHGKNSHHHNQQQHNNNSDSNTLKLVFSKDNRYALMSVVLVVSVSAASYYLIAIWLPMFMEIMRIPPIDHAFAISTMVGFIMIPLHFVGGWIADFFTTNGWKRLMILMALLLGILSPIFFKQISTIHTNMSETTTGFFAFIYALTLGCFMILYSTSMTPFIVSRFPVEVRLTSLSIAYNIALCVFGGFSPSVATLLTDANNQDATSAGIIITVLAAISIIGIVTSPSYQYSNNESSISNDGVSSPVDPSTQNVEAEESDLYLSNDNDGKDSSLPQIS